MHIFFLYLQEINENLNFDEQILEAAKSIMNAAGALINAATSAQKEIATQVKVSSSYLVQFDQYSISDRVLLIKIKKNQKLKEL